METKYQVFFINLEERKDRLEKIINEFKDFSNLFELNRFNAIKDKEGWRGCAKSHLELIKYAKKNNLEYIITCEDDVIIKDKVNFEKRFRNIINFLFNNLDKWDVFNASPLCPCNFKIKSNFELLDKTENICKISFGASTTFMIFNKSSYDKILNYSFKNNIDNYIGQKCKIITSIPFLVIQEDGFSNTCNNNRENLKEIFDKSESFLIKKIKKEKN